MIRPRLVLFDCDGVIVESWPATSSCLRANLSRHGVDLSERAFAEVSRAGTMGNVADAVRKRGAVLPADWLEDFYEELYERLGRDTSAIEGITEVFDWLDSAGIPYAVCSNGRVRKMQIMLTRLGYWDRLRDHVYSAQDLDAPKPAPDVYLKAAHDRGIEPATCTVIEDSVTGARAARAAGMRCFGYTGSGNTDELAPFTNLVFQHMCALPVLLGLETPSHAPSCQ